MQAVEGALASYTTCLLADGHCCAVLHADTQSIEVFTKRLPIFLCSEGALGVTPVFPGAS